MDNLLAGTLISLFVEFQCRIIVQRRCRSSCLSVIDIPLQAERHSGRQQQLFAFPPESAFTFRPEYCSDSQRNGVRLQTGIAFIFDRIPQSKSTSSVLRPDGLPNTWRRMISRAVAPARK
jgi:hypothetical protein